MSISYRKKSENEAILSRLSAFLSETFGSLRKAGEAVGRSTNYYVNYISREAIPSFDVLIPLQKHGLDLYWMFSGQAFSHDLEVPKLDFETRRAYILQKQYEERKIQEGADEPETSNPTKGDRMDGRTLVEIWDKISTQFPGTPLWEQLDETTRRDAMFDVYETLLQVQRGIKINPEEDEK